MADPSARYDRTSELHHAVPLTTIGRGKSAAEVYAFRDVLNLAQLNGLQRTEVNQLYPDPTKDGGWICIVEATFLDGTRWQGVGDAAPDNVNSLIARHLPRMAQTRALARALAHALNLDAVTAEELGGSDSSSTSSVTPQASSSGEKMSPNQEKYLTSLARQAGVPDNELDEILNERFGHGLSGLLKSEASTMIGSLQEIADERAAE